MKIWLAAALCAGLLAPSQADARSGTCTGCACRGGSGYRSNTGCVKEKSVKRVCGEPATTRCKLDGKVPEPSRR